MNPHEVVLVCVVPRFSKARGLRRHGTTWYTVEGLVRQQKVAVYLNGEILIFRSPIDWVDWSILVPSRRSLPGRSPRFNTHTQACCYKDSHSCDAKAGRHNLERQ